MLFLHRANRPEDLAAELAHLLRTRPLPDPMTREVIAVPGRGMERWLSHALALHLSATANIEWPFPAHALGRTLAAFLDSASETGILAAAPGDPWQPDRLTWAILAALPDHLASPAFAPLQTYLHESEPVLQPAIDRRRYLLARRIADALDRYATWRPDLVTAWDRNEPGELPLAAADAWQPVLWRDIRARMAAEPFYLRVADLERRLQHGPLPRPEEAPERLILFGISQLPPLHLRLLQALGRCLDVHLFVLAPSQALWTHVRNRATIARRLQQAGPQVTAEDLLLEEGNPLIASFGQLGRAFQDLLSDLTGPQGIVELPETYTDPAPEPENAQLLHVLQSDVLNLRHRGHRLADGTVPVPPVRLLPTDDSVRVLACHGPMRQVEVLRDELLALLDADRTLQPRDIVVMAVDVEAYAPLVEAVFQGGHPGEPNRADPQNRWGNEGFPRIPVAIADRSLRRDNPVAEALLRVLGLLRTRATATELLDLLALEPVRRRFDIEPDDLPQLQAWVAETGIRWGLDAAHRVSHGQPDDGQNTWRFGIDRLLVGVAMAEDDGRLFAGVLPLDDVEGAGTVLVGRLAEFVDTVTLLARELSESRTIPAWGQALADALDRVTATPASARWLSRQVRDALAQIVHDGADVGAPVTADAIGALLDGRFAIPAATKGQVTGAVTFCALVPMRSIPFRVVCLLGLDEDAFPRQSQGGGFDLVAARPQPGDRNARDDDRYLFLEAILAARSKLRLFYTGRDGQLNQERPPAVPVAELVDVLCDSAGRTPDEKQAVRTALVQMPPLQPFSPRNFGLEGTLRSYDVRMVQAARRLGGTPLGQVPPLFTGPLPPPTPMTGAGTVVQLRDLERFLAMPVNFLLQKRLGIYLGDGDAGPVDSEPVELDGLGNWLIGNGLLVGAQRGRQPAVTAAAMRATGQLPQGTPGQILHDDAALTVAGIAARAAVWQQGTLRTVALDTVVDVPRFGPVRLSGTVDRVWAAGVVDVRFSKLKPKYLQATWLHHLALQRAEPDQDHAAVAIGAEDAAGRAEVRFGPLADSATGRALAAGERLATLLQVYLDGQCVPLALFPATSHAYVHAWRQPKWTEDGERYQKATAAAAKAWSGDGGDGADPHVASVFADLRPYIRQERLPAQADRPDLAFHPLAMAVWAPLLAAAEAD